MPSKAPNGLGTVAKPPQPGYNVGINLGYCSLAAIRNIYKPTSTPADNARLVPVAAKTTRPNSRLKMRKSVPLDTPAIVQLSVASPCVGAVEVVRVAQ